MGEQAMRGDDIKRVDDYAARKKYETLMNTFNSPVRFSR